MISLLLACLALALAGAATVIAAFTLRGEEALQGWVIAGLGESRKNLLQTLIRRSA